MKEDCRSEVGFVPIAACVPLDGLYLVVQSLGQGVGHAVNDGVQDSAEVPLQCFPRSHNMPEP